MSGLHTRAMLATMTISLWTAMRKDDAVAKEVDKQHNANKAGLYRKFLVPKEALEGCHDAARALREHHYKHTLPWADGGTRLLPTKLYSAYDQEFNKLRDDYYIKIDEFVTLYRTTLISTAQAQLGSLFNPKDYPDASEIRSKFGVQLDLAPVPSEADFRVDIGAGEIKRIQAALSAQLDQRQKAAVDDAWRRICDVVGNVHVRLSAERPVIRESLADHVQELARLLPALNFNDEPLLMSVSQRISDDLILDLALLRKSELERDKIARKAQAILDMVPHEYRAVQEAA
jgi:hypothetical protein